MRWDGRSQDQRGSHADTRRSADDWQARGGSRARPQRVRYTQHYDDRDDRWPDEGAPQGGGIWGDDEGGEWQGDQGWTDDAVPTWSAASEANARAGSAAARSRGKASGKSNKREQQPLSQRIRYWLTAEAWQPSVLRTWPSTVRLLVVAALLGSCGGLGLFATRDQVGAQSGLTTGLSPLLHVTVGPGTPPPSLYSTWTPYPTQPVTPTPTTPARPTPTASKSPLLRAALSPQLEQCSLTPPHLSPVSLALDNSLSSVTANWSLTIGPGPSGYWATASATSGSIPAHQQQQPPVTLTPDQSICSTFIGGTQQYKQYLVQVTVNSGGQAIPLTFTVESPIGPGPTPSPSPSPGSTKVPAGP